MVAPTSPPRTRPRGSAMLDSFKIDISHQEMERIIIELELIYKTQPDNGCPSRCVRRCHRILPATEAEKGFSVDGRVRRALSLVTRAPPSWS